ncbi:hypothetical protein ABZ801_20455 [Actinomadura sp. NPDC047616]|uniref:hypothetical protein n=1 Tax=Actinomadura sp. NPDC047616 TaxID=3155914 RepID=UPI0033F8327E
MGVLALPVLVLIVVTYVAILNTPGGLRLRARFPSLVGAVLPALVCLPLAIGFIATGMTEEGVVVLLAYAVIVVIFAILADLLRQN